MHKTVFRLENLIDVTKTVKDVGCEAKMGTDKGILEREDGVLDLPKGER